MWAKIIIKWIDKTCTCISTVVLLVFERNINFNGKSALLSYFFFNQFPILLGSDSATLTLWPKINMFFFKDRIWRENIDEWSIIGLDPIEGPWA